MMEKMKAFVLTGKGEGEYKDVEKPVCANDGMILKIEAVGLCGSDVRNLRPWSFKGYISGNYRT